MKDATGDFPLKLILTEQENTMPGVSVFFDLDTAQNPPSPILVCSALNLGQTPEKVLALLQDTVNAIAEGEAVRKLAESAGHEMQDDRYERNLVVQQDALDELTADAETNNDPSEAETIRLLRKAGIPEDQLGEAVRGIAALHRAPLAHVVMDTEKTEANIAPRTEADSRAAHPAGKRPRHIPFNPKPTR